MTAAATGDTYEWWRKGSRRCTLEMCTSTTGSPMPEIASAMATEVWVKAPGFNTMPAASPRAAWRASMRTPSWLDCRKPSSKPAPAAASRQSASTSASVWCP